MFHGQLQKSEDRFVVVIPQEEVDRLGLIEGQFVSIHLTPMIDSRPVLPPDLQKALDEVWPWLEPGLAYLAPRDGISGPGNARSDDLERSESSVGDRVSKNPDRS